MAKSYFGSMSATTEDDPRLVIRIDNAQPVALEDFALCLQAWESQFESYLKTTTDPIDNRSVRLYVREVRKGSLIVDLIPFAPVIGTMAVLPFIDNINTVARFAGYMKKVVGSFLQNRESTTKPPLMSNTDFKDIGRIVQPLVMDNASSMILETHIHGKVDVHVHIGSADANTIQNLARIFSSEPPIPPIALDGVRPKVLLSWHQVNKSPNNASTSLGYIDAIAEGAKRIIFDDDIIKQKMVHDDPFNKIFLVDVEPLTTQGKLVAYKVIALHESFPKPLD